MRICMRVSNAPVLRRESRKPCLRDLVQTTLDGYLQLEWQDVRKPPRLKPLPPPAERVYTEAELKLIHDFMCVHAGVCLELGVREDTPDEL